MSRLRDFIVARALAGNHDPIVIPAEVLGQFEQRMQENTCGRQHNTFSDAEVAAIIKRNTN